MTSVENMKFAKDELRNRFICSMIIKNQLELLEILFKNGIDVNTKSIDGFTFIHVACFFNREDIVKLLIREGANVKAKADYYWTPLHNAAAAAAWQGSVGIIKLLIDNEADVNAGSNSKSELNTPLHIAAQYGRNEVVALFINASADINTIDANGNTPLHIASINGHDEVVQILIDAGANLNVKNVKGDTPLHCARKYYKVSIFKLLINNGADPSIKNNNNETVNDLSQFITGVSKFGQYVTTTFNSMMSSFEKSFSTSEDKEKTIKIE